MSKLEMVRAEREQRFTDRRRSKEKLETWKRSGRRPKTLLKSLTATVLWTRMVSWVAVVVLLMGRYAHEC